MLVNRRAADRLQRTLEGGQAADAETARLARTARALASVSTPGGAPRAEFVVELRERLLAEAAILPLPERPGVPPAERTARRTSPVVLVVGRGVPRALAGAAASVLVVGSVVGVASRSAIPGSALYPVKGWLDSVAVQMAGSDLDRGLTHLSQAEEHIADTRELVDRRVDDGEPYLESLQNAVLAVRAGQHELGRAFDETDNPQALIAIRDFAARAKPQVEALRPEVPAEALPVLGELESLLATADATALRRLAACAPTCATLQQVGARPTDLPSITAAQPTTTTAPPASGHLPGTGAAVTADPDGSGAAPGVTAGSGGVTLGGDNSGATLSTDGADLTGPTISVSATSLPQVSATLPSVGVSSGGLTATVPDTTLGSLSLPGLTATVPLP